MKTISLFGLCIFIFFGCKNNTKQPQYQYIEVVQEQRFLGNPGPERELDAVSIETANDTLAYIEAFKLFIQSNKKNVDAIQSGVAQFDTPIDFKLLDASGKDIAKTTTFSTKEKVENEIFDEFFKVE